MYTSLIALTSLLIGAEFAFYAGAFLPVTAALIRQEKEQKLGSFRLWTITFTLSSLAIGLLIFVAQVKPSGIVHPVFNIFLLIVGVLLIARAFIKNTGYQNFVSGQFFLTSTALCESTQVIHAVAAPYGITEQPTFRQMTVSIFCFIVAVVLAIAFLSFIVHLLTRLSATGKLAGYLATLFGVLCFVIGLLNLISFYG